MWLRRIKTPILYQGINKRKNYFEGWYFKQVSEDGRTVISIIPGISLGENDPHCFIQVITTRESEDNLKNSSLMTEYFRFRLDEFKYLDDPFSIEIRENIFSETGVSLFLESETIKIEGQINFGPLLGIVKNLRQPGIMGFFGYIPNMECFHEIISMSNFLEGTLELNGEKIQFENGKGYIEKDWGISFPKSYLWIQSNHFDGTDAAFMCSVADIPFLGRSFKGFICNFNLGGKEYRFASYNGSKLEVIEFSNVSARLILRRRNLVLKIDATLEMGAFLKAPLLGEMTKQVKEGLFGIVALTLENSKGEILFNGFGKHCGIELML